MSHTINDYTIDEYCTDVAVEAYKEVEGDRDKFDEFIWQSLDGCEYVIYYHKSREFISNCNTDQGEDFVEEVYGTCLEFDLNEHIQAVVFGELYRRTSDHFDILEDAAEAEEAEAA